MNTFREVFRASYPKNLRFDKASQILFAQCFSLAKQYKNKKYIPKASVEELLQQYEPLPGSPVLQLPVIRHVLLIRPINSVRVYAGYKSWLYNRNVETEYNKIKTWLEAQKSPSSVQSFSKSTQSKLGSLVDREKFEKEVLQDFKVATLYQRGVRLGLWMIVILLILIYISVRPDLVVYAWLRYYKKYSAEEVKEFFRQVCRLHTAAEIPTGYQHLLPPPTVCYASENDKTSFAVSIIEFYEESSNVSVIVIPSPLVGPKSFFDQVSKITRLSDAVLLEGVTFKRIDKVLPAYFFPFQQDTFPSLALHHRYLNVVGAEGEPPKLYPAGVSMSWKAYIGLVLIPFEIRSVYLPTYWSATKSEARVGWGRLKEAIDIESDISRERAKIGDTSPRIIAVPWTVNHVVNLEASLLKAGFKVKRTFTVHWLDEDHLGDSFCNYFDYH